MSGIGALQRPTAEAWSVTDLVKLARKGSVRMPRFQRGFHWSAGDVDKLFDSLWRGFPIGSLLLWERDAPAGDVAFGSFELSAEASSAALWVVDGQHRLTALVGTLTAHPEPWGPFELYFDMVTSKFVRRGQRRSVPVEWLPLNLLLDTTELLDYLIAARDGGLDQTAISRARDLASAIGDYRVPLNIVKTDDERVLREIFYRMNSAGRRMTAAEVFRALHAALEPGSTGDLRTLIDEVNSQGFGALRDDTVVRCVLAIRGGDVYRSFEQEFGPDEDPAEAFEQTSESLRRVFAFLRADASVPHVRALPYPGVLPILTRFFSLHPTPDPRTRNLLRRWIWRGSMAWGRDVSALRQAVQDVTPNEIESIGRLLSNLGERAISGVDLQAVQLNKAAAKMNVALMASLRPKHLIDGSSFDVQALLEQDGPGALLELVPSSDPTLSARMLHPAVDETDLVRLLRDASQEVLESHVIPRAALDALAAGDTEGFLAVRSEALVERLNDQRRKLAEPDASDRPSIAALTVDA